MMCNGPLVITKKVPVITDLEILACVIQCHSDDDLTQVAPL